MMKKLSILMFLAVFMALTSTLVAQTTCQIKIVGEDSYGDGWNDGVLSVVQGGTTVITWAAPNTDHGSGGPFYDSTMVTVSNSPISFVWTEGDYDGEVTIWIYNANGVLLFTVNEPSSGTIFSMANPCSNCFAPSNLHLTSVSSDSASLAWAGDANGNYGILWGTVADVLAGNGTSGTATTNSITFSNLTASTGYMIMVWTDCGNNETSDTTTFIFSTIADAVNTFPYTTGFEATDDVAWTFINDATNKWYIGSATNNGGTNSLYISNDNGTTNAYNISATQFSYAYRPFSITDSGQYAVSFDWKANGESNYDYLRAWIAPASAISSLSAGHTPDGNNSAYNYVYPNPVTPTGWVDLGGKMNLQTSWQTLTATPSLTAGSYVLLFMWANDDSQGSTPAAAVDNIIFTQLSCPQPTALTVSGITATDATLTWTAGGSETEWEMSINGGTWESVVSPVLLDTLTANTPYSIRVRAVCGYDDTSFVTVIAFRTMCTLIDSLPYTENFDGVTGATTTSVAVNNLPSCWNYHNVGTSTSYSGYPIVYSSASTAHSGSNAMRFYTYITAGTYADQYAILPMTDSTLYPVNTLQVDFWMRSTSTSYSSYAIVGVMTNPADASSFVPVETVYTNASTTYAHHEVLLGSYNGPHGCVAFKFPRPASSYNAGLVDDITLDVMPTCPPVNNLQVIHTTPDSIVVSWVPNGSESVWLVSDGTNEYATYDTIFAFDNLNSSTTYTITVRAYCDVDDTSTAVSVTAHTECLYATLPITENFDGMTGSTATSSIPQGYLPMCWDIYNDGTRASYQYAPYVYNSSTYAHSGANSIRFYSYNSSGDSSQYLILPAVDPDEYLISDLQLSFWLRGNSTSSGYFANVVVGVMTNPADESSFIPYDTINYASTTYVFKKVNFSHYTGPHGRVTMMFPKPLSSSQYEYGYVDDITLEVAPTCPPVISHSVTATASAAHITWTYDQSFANGPASYTVSYGFASDSLATPMTVNVTETELVLTGLVDDTAYMVSITPVCTDGSVASEVFTFTTQALPCLEWDTTGFGGPTDTLTVGTPGSSTTNGMPVNTGYNYSYCQHLILASHIATTGPTNFSGIAFDYAYSQPMTHATNCQIYMGNTTRSTFTVSSPADSAFVPYSQLQLVYSGPLNCTTNGYNYFQFNQGAFAYDGTSNIIVAIVDNSGSYDGTSYVFRYETTSGAAMTHRVYNNNTPYGPTEMDAARANQSYWRTNMKLLTGGGTCVAQASCYAPAVTVEPDTAGNIEISWIPGYQETSWNLDYKADGDATWTNVLTGTSLTNHTISISSLLSNTNYTFRVTPNCTDTVLFGTASFLTPCGVMAVPFSENFDGMVGSTATSPVPAGYLPQCWDIYNDGTRTNYQYAPYVYNSTTYSHSGANCIRFYSYNSSGDSNQYLILPIVDTTLYPVNTLQLSFWLRAYNTSSSYFANVVVGVMTDPTVESSFIPYDTVSSTSTTYANYDINFNHYTGPQGRITMLFPKPLSSSQYEYGYVDDITLGLIPACPHVTDLAVDMVTNDSVQISWAAGGNETEWSVSSDGTTWTSCYDSTYIFAGLTANTLYTFYVRPVCGVGDTGYSQNISVRTACSAASIPYTEDFESYNSGTSASISPCWVKGTNSATAYPYPSTTAISGSRSLYFYAYHPSSTTSTPIYSYAALPMFQQPLDSLQMDFKVRTYSTSANYYTTYLVVGVMTNPNDISTFVGVDTINLFGAAASSVHDISVTFASYTGNGQYIAIYDPVPPVFGTSSYNYSYAYVDDITVDYLPTCPRVENLVSTGASTTSITIDWTDVATGTPEWQVSYSDGTAIQTTIVTSHPATISGLSALTGYTFKVRPICGVGDTGHWSMEAMFSTAMCDNAVIASTGASDGTGYTTPVNNLWKYTLSETIIDSAELAGIGDITSIAYSYAYSTAMTDKTDVTIWLQPTNKTAFASSSDLVVLDTTIAVQVYHGDLNCSLGWNYFSFTAPYTWDGHSNLLVIVDDNSNDYNSSAYVFDKTSCTEYKTIEWHSDSYNPDPTSTSYSGTKNYYQYRATMQLISCGAGCANPSSLHTTSVTYNSVEVAWSGTDSAEVGIHQGLWDETGATIATVTTSSYTFTGLTPNMQYTIAVRNLCPDDMTSDWVYLSVTTDDLPCFAPTNVQVSNETPSGAKVTWTAGGNETEWVVNVFRSGVVDTNYTVINTPMCNVNGLYSAMTYTVKVGAVCGGIDTMWSETTTLTTTACLPPTNVNAVANGHQAIVTWEGTGANEYHVLWFLQGFTTDGDSVIATNGTTNATIDGLQGGEDYDIYVYAYCDGQRSAQAGQTSLHVTGIDDINTSAINLYPNPANTTVTVDGIEGEALVTIVDMNGRTVFSEKTVSSITIDLGGMAKGAYFVRITGENSSAIRKLIVK